jgi:ADP-heptose:LPS heptosyltransferase
MPQPASSKTRSSEPVQRVLIYRLGSLGDTVVALPALHLVERIFPHADRRMLTNFPVSAKAPAAAEILGNSGLVHGYFRYPASTRNPFVLLKLLWTIRRWRPQVLVYMAASRGVAAARRDARFFLLCGIAMQLGVPLTEDMQQNRLELPDNTREFECERLSRNLALLGDAQLDTPDAWDLHLNAAERERAAEVLESLSSGPILAISVGTKRQSKDWGRENWQSLLRLLGARYSQYSLVLLGSPDEVEASDFAAQGWREAVGASASVVNLCGHLTPRESAAVLERARLFLGHDSGPMHLAAAVGTPCVAIFSARKPPRLWFPYGPQHRVIFHEVSCMGCALETCIVERKRCLTSITIAEVAAQVDSALLR